MNNTEYTIDADQVLRMFSEFDARKRKKVYRRAVTSALNIVKKQALVNLRGVVNPSMINHKDEWGNSFRKGIKTKVYRDTKSGSIHIMNNFKLKFFELGTTNRYTRTYRGRRLRVKRSTGRISASHFFTRAKTSKEREVFGSIDRLISESIVRINNRYR